MRFNSFDFIFVFLPLTWVGWRLASGAGRRQLAIFWLSLCSLGFYGYWNWHYVPLLIGSLVLNFALGRGLIHKPRLCLLVIGLGWNLGLLGYFKYFNFFIGNVDAVTGLNWPVRAIILPLGISFFSFQKIAFLVDAWRGELREARFGDFALFVLFFPQLIAGPIVHHQDFMPQLKQSRLWHFDQRRFLLGGLLFSVGLFSKAVIADTLAPIADSAFGLAANGVHLRIFEAWCGVFAYGLQLFYDFAGYSHMALGLGLLFGFKLPINFFAPYTSGNMIEFWRRWHITLSAFLRDYVYIPLGGSRHGFPVQIGNLLFAFLLAGIWHGAGWNFVLWGLWHGVALVINHLWRRSRAELAPRTVWWGTALTFLTVQMGWVLFRAPDIRSAWLLGKSLFGYHGISVPISLTRWVNSLAPTVRPQGLFPDIFTTPSSLLVLVLSAWCALRGTTLLAWSGVTADDVVATPPWIAEKLPVSLSLPSWRRLALAALMFAISLAALTRSSPFLYFQF